MTASRHPSVVTGFLLLLALVLVAGMACRGDSSSDSDVVAATPVRLTWTRDEERNPAWSPKGDKIAFRCVHYSRSARIDEVVNRPISPVIAVTSRICVMNADGSSQERLNRHRCGDADPSWSPDGSKIVFSSYRDGNRSIHMMNGDGSQLRWITIDDYSNMQPAWSPDGSQVAFSSYRGGQWDIYVMDADGSNLTRVTNARGSDAEPAWSPDGRKIAFASDAGVDGIQNLEIYVVNIDGTGLTRLTNRPNRDSDPAWSPDGRKIVFTSNLVGNSEIYVMEVGR